MQPGHRKLYATWRDIQIIAHWSCSWCVFSRPSYTNQLFVFLFLVSPGCSIMDHCTRRFTSSTTSSQLPWESSPSMPIPSSFWVPMSSRFSWAQFSASLTCTPHGCGQAWDSGAQSRNTVDTICLWSRCLQSFMTTTISSEWPMPT